MTLDAAWVRAQFPAFSEPSLQGWAFFENAGGSYACAPVIDRLTRFYRERKLQPYAPYPASEAAGAEMDEARSRLAAMLGVQTQELSFGPSTSQNSYVLAQAVCGWLSPGDAIVVSDQDHEANAGVWRRLAEAGIEVREWRLDPETHSLQADSLPPLLDGAKLLCFPHCSNVVGEINDVAAICALAREAGVRTVVDGVSYAPHGLPDVGALGADVYLFSAYKTYGPHQGLMVIRESFGAELPGQAHFFNNDTLYKRFTPAGPDHAQVAASAGIADYLEALSAQHSGPATGAPAARHAHDVMRAREVELLAPLLEYLSARNDLRLLGPRRAEARAPTVAVSLREPAEPVAARLAAHKVMAGGGDFYARRPLGALGIDPEVGVLRLSFTHYTTPAEIEQLIAALDAEL
ncbi:aminotransferase class V-fold PLP-dependent enzyme [Pseudoroseicyclus tamaricis]|uniref:Aminotransferase class V-fold PLP-dependent enzyme n=1 Tax=Pseudoroseicyclus tamaricis TaxID=2705421 RepID=A0A6B2K2N9_9RHOB|nr:aminotransferase class V-fold PLP-dependent enzyme [Pseudoroseicyclus tamaricis]NDV00736.1 aminotransferase class V-fold PLP-dependent enzyme [Pseudoroseicyclus tamaricis]